MFVLHQRNSNRNNLISFLRLTLISIPLLILSQLSHAEEALSFQGAETGYASGVTVAAINTSPSPTISGFEAESPRGLIQRWTQERVSFVKIREFKGNALLGEITIRVQQIKVGYTIERNRESKPALVYASLPRTYIAAPLLHSPASGYSRTEPYYPLALEQGVESVIESINQTPIIGNVVPNKLEFGVERSYDGTYLAANISPNMGLDEPDFGSVFRQPFGSGIGTSATKTNSKYRTIGFRLKF